MAALEQAVYAALGNIENQGCLESGNKVRMVLNCAFHELTSRAEVCSRSLFS